MKTVFKILFISLVVAISAYIFPGIHVNGFSTALIVALIISVLNSFIRPLLIFLTIPVTIFTLGFFLLIINGLMVKMTESLVNGFRVDSFWWAILLSLLISITTSLFEKIHQKNESSIKNEE